MSTVTPDTMKIEVPYASTADLSLSVRLGPCRLRFTPTDGPSFVSGTYTDPTRTLPIDVQQRGGAATISQRFEPMSFSTVELPRLELGISRERPFALDIQAGASDNSFDLGGLPITRLTLKAGAARFETDFSKPNPTQMSVLEVGLGAGSFIAHRLANANFGELRLGGGLSATTLDFSGNLQRDAHGRIEGGLASVDIFVPASTSVRIATKAFAAGKTVVGLTERGDAYYSAPALEGKHPLLELDVSMAFGALAISAT
jgi:hypothetical protein